jgi:hypothetical protein
MKTSRKKGKAHVHQGNAKAGIALASLLPKLL